MDAAAFELAKTIEFNDAYTANPTPVDPGITVPSLPANCQESAQDVLMAANRLVDDLGRKGALCKWLDEELARACKDQAATLTGMLAANMLRLPDSVAKSASIMAELFAANDGGFADLEAFSKDQADKFAALMLPAADTGVVVPTVSDDCTEVDMGEAKDAAAALTAFLADLGTALAYQEYLQDQLDVICAGIETTITDLTMTVTSKIDDECGPDTLVVLRDLYDLEQQKDGAATEAFLDFTQRIRGDYDMLLAEMRVDIIGSEVDIPTLPENCNEASHTARAGLTAKDLELEDCLSFMNWVGQELQKACVDCGETLISQIDF